MKQGPGVSSPGIGAPVGITYAADACLACGKSLINPSRGFSDLFLCLDHCLQGGETTCKQSKISGYFTPGTFQQYVVSPARYVIPIPPTIEPSMAAPLMCGGLSVYAALKRAEVRPGAWVVVCGAGGGLGHLGIQYAKAMSGRVLALDTDSKRQFCLDLGADDFLDFAAYQMPALLTTEIQRITGGGASIVLMCTSSSRAYSQSMSWLGFRGTLACLGIPKENHLNPRVMDMVTYEQRIIGKSAAYHCTCIPANIMKQQKLGIGLKLRNVFRLLHKVVSRFKSRFVVWMNSQRYSPISPS